MLEILESQIWTIDVWEIALLLGIGIIAGMAGGLLGIGGAVVNIPALSLLMSRDIHLAQAIAMNVTFFVALPAAIRHYKEGQLDSRLLKMTVPFALLAIIGGVFLSGVIPDIWMQRIFGAFLVYVIIANIIKLMPGRKDYQAGDARISLGRSMVLGGIGGGGAGLLGIGGGLLNVPVSQKICRIPLPVAIATSSAIMCFTSIIGAITKDVTLPMVPVTIDGKDISLPWYEPLKYAIWLIPTCVAGSWFGAKLTHALPLRTVRSIFLIVVAMAAVKMLW